MARAESSGGRRRESKRSSSRGRSRSRDEGSSSSSFEEHQKNRSSGGRSSGRSSRSRDRGSRDRGYSDRRSGGRDRGRLEMTEVTCSSCGIKCEVPFKPTSSKPVYCSNCYAKSDNASNSKASSKEFAIINEKLDKIIEAMDLK